MLRWEACCAFDWAAGSFRCQSSTVHLLVGEQQFVSLDDQIVPQLPGLAHHRARRARLGCRKCKVQMIQKVQI
eukprot:scaffold76841_cov69-Phaeocystis_antarctica.AAC.10